jgi:hypothetical protein
MLADAILSEYGKLEKHLTPILYTARPFTGDIHRRQIKHLY